MKRPKASYTATCPICLAEHDFNSRKEVDAAWREWRAPGALLAKIAWQINPDNPAAAAEAMPEMWRLLNAAWPIIETVAQKGFFARTEPLWSEMTELSRKIERVIQKATKKEAA